jgi:hypothetical protein
MVRELRFGLMVPSMKESGETIRLMVKASSGTQMATFMKVNGKKIRPMVSEFISTLTEQNTKVTGRMISRMVEALRAGPMVASTMVSIRRA